MSELIVIVPDTFRTGKFIQGAYIEDPVGYHVEYYTIENIVDAFIKLKNEFHEYKLQHP